jgi:hypothetical protein
MGAVEVAQYCSMGYLHQLLFLSVKYIIAVVVDIIYVIGT